MTTPNNILVVIDDMLRDTDFIKVSAMEMDVKDYSILKRLAGRLDYSVDESGLLLSGIIHFQKNTQRHTQWQDH